MRFLGGKKFAGIQAFTNLARRKIIQDACRKFPKNMDRAKALGISAGMMSLLARKAGNGHKSQ